MKNKTSDSKIMKCKKCKKIVENCSVKALTVTCDVCVQKELERTLEVQNEVKGGLKMTEETMVKQIKKEEITPTEKKTKAKSEGSFGKSFYVKCSKCGEEKFARQEVYEARVKKFGGEAEMLKKYVCRKCKGAAKTA